MLASMNWFSSLIDKIRPAKTEPPPTPEADNPRADLLEKHEEKRDSGEGDADLHTTNP